ncbi:hypothetical protein [Pseudoxanthomonas sp.]|uniref:hypothetical protein n=1 Tax=Pseudoxanthomonas sp. TaxID=1871049 RepID=UPI0025D896E5|nr:hypothetical protein [Pseudoxanthomonas sp.]
MVGIVVSELFTEVIDIVGIRHIEVLLAGQTQPDSPAAPGTIDPSVHSYLGQHLALQVRSGANTAHMRRALPTPPKPGRLSQLKVTFALLIIYRTRQERRVTVTTEFGMRVIHRVGEPLPRRAGRDRA